MDETSHSTGPQLCFAGYRLDPARGELWRGDARVELLPRPTALLLYLVRHRDRTVSKRELLDQIWRDASVSEAALTSAVKQVRQALGEAGHDAVRTSRGRGYRFAADVETAAAAQPLVPATPRQALPFVGRRAALAELASARRAAAGGAARFACVSGPPGIGKSRLAEAALRAAADEGWETAYVRCFEGPVAPPLWPWTQLFTECAAIRSPEALRALLGPGAPDLLQAMPGLADRIGAQEPPPAIEGTAARRRLHESVARAIERWAADAPVQIVIDDLHAADLPSLALLEFVSRAVSRARLVILGAYRDRAQGACAESLGRLRDACAVGIELEGLDPSEIAEMLRARGGDAPADRVAELHELSAGNPMFLGELLARQRDATGAPPRGLRDAIRHHFDEVSPECRRVLTRAAFLGRDFRPELVAASLDTELASLVTALGEASRVPLVEEHPKHAGLFRFVHALLPEVLAASLGPAERLDHHAALAEALLDRHGDAPDAPYAAVAHHLLEAAPLPVSERAFEIARRAAEQAETQLAYEDAAALLERVLGAPSLRIDPESRTAVLLDASRCHALAGHYEGARRRRDEAQLLARRLDSPELFARAALGPFPDDEVGQVHHARVLALEEALERLPADDSSVRAEVLARLGMALHFSEDLERGREGAARSVEMCRRLGDLEGLVRGLRFRHLASMGPDGAAERRARAVEILRHARRSGSTELLGHAFRTEIETAHGVGDREAFERGVRSLGTLADETRHPYLHWQATLLRSLSHWMDGDLARAETDSMAALELGLGFQEDAALSWTGVQLYSIRREQDRLGELETSVSDMQRRLPEVAPWAAAWAFLQLEIGRPDDARERLYAMAARPFAEIPKNTNYLLTLGLLAEVAAALRERELCAALRHALEPYADSWIPVGPTAATLGSVSHYLGLLTEAGEGAAQ
nr:AAA family ATPase [Myxococcota bacterium]